MRRREGIEAGPVVRLNQRHGTSESDGNNTCVLLRNVLQTQEAANEPERFEHRTWVVAWYDMV